MTRLAPSIVISFALLCGANLARAQSTFIAPLDPSEPVGYYIAPVPASFDKGDRQLAEWAVRAWARAIGPTVKLRPGTERVARIRLYWVEGNGSYGEMRPIQVGGRRGAAVYVRPVDDALGPTIARRIAKDRLFRDTILYLTCVHEIGHALGLTHTRQFEDIMYSFQFGGDIAAYFQRYRGRLRRRSDIVRHSGLSADDRARVRKLYAKPASSGSADR